MRLKSQTGDTIVEVMIAIVIVSTVLVGAFVLSRTSLKNVRGSEEHSQALKLVQGQLEQLKAAARTGQLSDFAGTFCMVDGAVETTLSNCTSDRYRLTVTNADPAHNTFRATATWDRLGGGTSQVRLSYRVVFGG